MKIELTEELELHWFNSQAVRPIEHQGLDIMHVRLANFMESGEHFVLHIIVTSLSEEDVEQFGDFFEISLVREYVEVQCNEIDART